VIPILYRDDWLVAVSKPAGLLVHRSHEARDRAFLLQRVRDQLGGDWLYPVHRLDRACSGVVVFGRSSDAARALQAALAAPGTIKEYLCLAVGHTAARFEIERPLTNRATGRKQLAHTSFWRVRAIAGCEDSPLTLLRARLHTGRRHQIRRHLARAGHFILGDTTYGKGRINRPFRARYALPRLCLHAHRLRLAHPEHGAALELFDPLADDLRAFFALLPGIDSKQLDCL
jgi:tRNA pseudouridine65 synthase